MDLESFCDIPDDFDVKAKLAEQARLSNQKASSNKTYVSETALDAVSHEKFDFEKEKQAVITNLKYLKSLEVEEFTFLKKFEEIRECADYGMLEKTGQYKNNIWSSTDINNEELTIKEISELQPEIVVVRTPEQEQTWAALRFFCHTAEYNQAPGRLLKFILIDKVSGKYLGFSSIASEVIAISCRDEWLGWTKEDKLEHKMLNHSAIGTTIAATQPFGSNFLGGKLMAAMLTTSVVRDEWKKDYGSTLVGMTTTSLYGPYSMYNGHRWWKAMGKTKGKIPLKPSEENYETWHRWLKQYKATEYNEKMTQKEGVSGPVTGAKNRVLSMIFDAIDIRQSDYEHGFERGVYYSCFYENTKEFLQRKITDDKLVMKPLWAGDVKAVLDWWKPKAIERYKKLKSENRLSNEKLFYADLRTMRNFDEAKEKYMNNVGK